MLIGNPVGSHHRWLTRVLKTQSCDFTVLLRAQPLPQCPLQIWVCSVLCPLLIPLGLPQCLSSLHFSHKCLFFPPEVNNYSQTPYLTFPPFNFPATLIVTPGIDSRPTSYGYFKPLRGSIPSHKTTVFILDLHSPPRYFPSSLDNP